MVSPERTKILVLDGGMGTTLENLGVDVSSSLWGSDLLLSDPEPIKRVHRGYVDCGADLIESATYPLSVPSIQREYREKNVNESEAILHTGLDIALDSTASPSSSPSSPSSRVVLALGPYGATTKPGSEYSGLYPRPYGFGSVLDLDPSPANSTTSVEEDTRAEDALYEWHRSRLESYRKSGRWGEVEWVGYETIPLLREIRAIRRALSAVGLGSGKERGPKVWIACTFPDGLSPETIPSHDNDSQMSAAGVSPSVGGKSDSGPGIAGGSGSKRYTVEDTVRALLEGEEARPQGIGINCTNPAFLPDIIRKFNDTIRQIQSTRTQTQTQTQTQARETGAEGEKLNLKPWLVVYPDGGQVYDPLTRTWSKEKMTPGEWAGRMMDIVHSVDVESGLWEGLIVGGCCKTSADEIGELRRRVDEYASE